MVILTGSQTSACESLGPLADDGAPYRVNGMDEFSKLQNTIMPIWDDQQRTLPDTAVDSQFWRNGKGKHASSAR